MKVKKEKKKNKMGEKKMKKFVRAGLAKYIGTEAVSQRPTQYQLYYLYKLITNRRPVTYTWSIFCKSIVKKVLCCCCKIKSLKKAHKLTKLFAKG